MAPQWSTDEDRALLLALVQVMAPAGPSKHQFEAAIKTVNERWTLSAVTQHFNKKLRLLDPTTLGLAAGDGGGGEGSKPSTRALASAIKRKAPTTRTANKTAAAAGLASPSPVSSGVAKKKGTVARAVFPNLRKVGKEVVAAAAAAASSSADEGEDDEVDEDDDDDDEQVASKKVRLEEGEIEE